MLESLPHLSQFHVRAIPFEIIWGWKFLLTLPFSVSNSLKLGPAYRTEYFQKLSACIKSFQPFPVWGLGASLDHSSFCSQLQLGIKHKGRDPTAIHPQTRGRLNFGK